MNRIILSVLALLAIAFAVTFVADLRGVFSVPRDPVAYVESYDGTIRRLPHNQLTWDRAGVGSLFAAEDTIQTGENGFVRLVFYAGGDLELGPGAMVALGGSIEEVELNFITGAGKIRLAKKLKGKIKIKNVILDRYISGKTENKKNRIKIEIVDKIEIEKKPTQEEIKKGKSKISKLDLENSLKKIFLDKKRKLTKEIEEQSIKNKKNALQTNGKIIHITAARPPELVSPPEDASVDLAKKKTAQFLWKKPKGEKVKQYELLLRSTESLKSKPRIIRTRTSKFALNKIGKGKYFWSVRAINAKGRRGASSEIRFIEIISSLSGIKKQKLQKPKIRKAEIKISRPLVMPVRVE